MGRKGMGKLFVSVGTEVNLGPATEGAKNLPSVSNGTFSAMNIRTLGPGSDFRISQGRVSELATTPLTRVGSQRNGLGSEGLVRIGGSGWAEFDLFVPDQRP